MNVGGWAIASKKCRQQSARPDCNATISQGMTSASPKLSDAIGRERPAPGLGDDIRSARVRSTIDCAFTRQRKLRLWPRHKLGIYDCAHAESSGPFLVAQSRRAPSRSPTRSLVSAIFRYAPLPQPKWRSAILSAKCQRPPCISPESTLYSNANALSVGDREPKGQGPVPTWTMRCPGYSRCYADEETSTPTHPARISRIRPISAAMEKITLALSAGSPAAFFNSGRVLRPSKNRGAGDSKSDAPTEPRPMRLKPALCNGPRYWIFSGQLGRFRQ
jgi:hypothetical protein